MGFKTTHVREGKCINFGRVKILLSLNTKKYILTIFSLTKIGKSSLPFVNGGVKKYLRVLPADKRARNILFIELEKEAFEKVVRERL